MRKTVSPAKGQRPAMQELMQQQLEQMQAIAQETDPQVLKETLEAQHLRDKFLAAFPEVKRYTASLPSHKTRGL